MSVHFGWFEITSIIPKEKTASIFGSTIISNETPLTVFSLNLLVVKAQKSIILIILFLASKPEM